MNLTVENALPAYYQVNAVSFIPSPSLSLLASTSHANREISSSVRVDDMRSASSVESMRSIGSNLEYTLVSDNSALERLCVNLKKEKIIMLDTEFYEAANLKLRMVQIKCLKGIFLIDLKKITKKRPLKQVFELDSIRKVFHACRGDLSVIRNCLGIKKEIKNVVDTQVLYSYLVVDEFTNIGYKDLVSGLCSVALAKEQTLSDWSRENLDDEQLRYAAEDVEYLLPCYERLCLDLKTRSHQLTWALEDCQSISAELVEKKIQPI